MSSASKKYERVTTGSEFVDVAMIIVAILIVMYALMFGCAVIATILCAIGVSGEIAALVYIVLYLAALMSGAVFNAITAVSNAFIKGINAVVEFDYSFGLWAKFKAA